jgi:hypothetical protein
MNKISLSGLLYFFPRAIVLMGIVTAEASYPPVTLPLKMKSATWVLHRSYRKMGGLSDYVVAKRPGGYLMSKENKVASKT